MKNDHKSSLFLSAVSYQSFDTPELEYALNATDEDDYPKAFDLFQRLANQGNPIAQYNLAVMYDYGLASNNHSQMVTWYLKAAEQGISQAQFSLGILYSQGREVNYDLEQAVFWLKKSASQDNIDAQSFLGAMYVDGFGVERDYELANQLFTKAAEKGDPVAQYNLGMSFLKGRGVIQDFIEAHKWLNIASVKDLDARRERAKISELMTPSQIEKAQQLASEWVHKQSR
jgi:TPR repeat protein